MVAAFSEGLDETGFSEDRNVAIEFRWGRRFRSVWITAARAEVVGALVRWDIDAWGLIVLG
jgi:hypothetical protein